MPIEDKKALVVCIAGSILVYNAVRVARDYWGHRRSEWIPVGVVSKLCLFPIKSCRRKEVFSFYCGPVGPSMGEVLDRHFMVVDEATQKFYTGRQLPTLVLLSADVEDGVLTVESPDKTRAAAVNISKVLERNKIFRISMHQNLQVDGLDCGDEIASFLQTYFKLPGVRLVMYKHGLYNGRYCRTEQKFWNNPVPKRYDEIAYTDEATYHITTEPSITAVNEQLTHKVSSDNYRANIVIDKCAPYDEDKWADLRIGDVELQCYKPCDRCVLTSVNPDTGKPEPQALKELRTFRLAPEGKVREAFGDRPLFGVFAGIMKQGYIHVGQTVWVRYKPSAF